MSRPVRIEFKNALYHVTSRGDRQEDIYEDDSDRRLFLEVLKDVYQRYNWRIHAYCLMNNHYHLLIETPDANLSKGMRHLNGVYTQRYNHRHKRVGHVFLGRYKAILVQKNSYLLELARYIVLNPIRARRVKSVREWAWSSYRATVGQVQAPSWLYTDWLLSAFSKQKARAIKQYKQFVAEGKTQASPWAELKQQIYMGDARFVDTMQAKIKQDADLSEVPAAQKRPTAKPLSYYAKRYKARDRAIVESYASGGYSMGEIGAHFELHYSRISRIVTGAKSKT